MGKEISYSNGLTDRQTSVVKSANSRYYSMNSDFGTKERRDTEGVASKDNLRHFAGLVVVSDYDLLRKMVI